MSKNIQYLYFYILHRASKSNFANILNYCANYINFY